MIIKTQFSELEKAVSSLNDILVDKMTNDEMRNLIFWVKEDSISVVGKNVYVCGIAEIDGEFEGEIIDTEKGDLIPVRAKEICGVLDSYKSLKRTKATSITFDIGEKVINLTIDEEPVSEDIPYADKYYRTNHYSLSKPRSVSESISRDIYSVATIPNGVQINKADIMPYFNALLPTIRDSRDSVATRLNVVGDYIYTAPSAYVAIMQNSLNDSEIFSDFVLTSTSAAFIKSFFELSDVTTFAKKDEGDSVLLSLENEYARAVVRALSKRKGFNIDNYTDMPSQGVGVDKGYLVDVLRRMAMSQEAIKMTIKKGEDIELSTPKIKVSVPVIVSRFEDDFEQCTVTINPAIFNNLIFSYVNFGELIFIYFTRGKNSWDFTITDDAKTEDNKHLWFTKVKLKGITG